jgi:hypothetical protein
VSHGDAYHPDTAGFIRIAKRQAQAVLNVLLPSTYTTGMKGASPVSATFSGSDITITFTLHHGTTLQGLTGATSLTGFVVKNASGVIQTITATAIPTPTTVVLTMATLPATGWTVDYIPNQYVDPANLLYTNASVIGDTVGVPARPWTGAMTM